MIYVSGLEGRYPHFQLPFFFMFFLFIALVVILLLSFFLSLCRVFVSDLPGFHPLLYVKRLLRRQLLHVETRRD